jgi:hypothetical protein
MADPNQPFTPDASQTGRNTMFAEPAAPERSFPTVPVAIAAVAVLILLAVLVAVGRRHGTTTGAPDTLRPLATYAPNLKISGLQMSESTSFSGGKSTFIDGHIANSGPATVTGVTVQVLFASDGGGAPQLETVPLNLVRTRQPYVDVQPVSAAPLAPGAGGDFRLIFEGIRPEWNQQVPEIHVVEVATK